MIDKNIFIYEKDSVKDALKKLNQSKDRVLLTVDLKGRLLGTLSDGDIRRYILKGKSLDANIQEIYNKKPVFMYKKCFTKDLAKDLFIKSEKKVELIPILNDRDIVIDVVTWRNIFSESDLGLTTDKKLNIPVVIMAGGKGERLEPFTKIIPKPLIPIGDKTIVEIIIEQFRKHGISEYFLSLNYKSKMIESYFESIEKNYTLNYLRESDYLGTAGSLSLLKDNIGENFFVSNCDVIVRADLEEVVALHKKSKAICTVLSSIQHYRIPYGVIDLKEKGEIIKIHEKPEYTFIVNAGVYLLNKAILDFIPANAHFNMTDLIKILIKEKKKVITYPVNENDYIDIGQLEEYNRAIGKLQLFK